MMISVIVPLHNEEESLGELYKELIKVLPGLDKTYEIIFIDDGSMDDSLDTLKRMAQKDNRLRIFSFRKRRGKADALSFGFKVAKGDYIFTIDADLEDMPSEMPKLFNKLKEGYDAVSGWRKNRKHSLGRVISSKFSNYIIGVLWDFKLHDHNCGLKLFTKEAAKSSDLYGGLYRFVLLMIHQNGYRVGEVEISHQSRKYGKSKYGFFRLWKDFPDIFTILFLTKFSQRPLHFFGMIGGISFLLGFIFFSYLSIIWLMGESIGRRPLLLVSILLMIAGFQTFFTGFLAELILNKSAKQEEIPLKYSTDLK